MFSRKEQAYPGPYRLRWRYRAWAAIVDWASFQAKLIPLYFLLALLISVLADISNLAWAIWYVLQFTGAPPGIEVPL